MPRTVWASLAVATAAVTASWSGDGFRDWANRTFDPLLRWFEDAPQCDGEDHDFVTTACGEWSACGFTNYWTVDANRADARHPPGMTLARQSFGWSESSLRVCEQSEGMGERRFELDLGRPIQRVVSLSQDHFYIVSETSDGLHQIDRWVKSPTMSRFGGPWLTDAEPVWNAELLVPAGSLGEIVELSPDSEDSVLLVVHGEPRRLSTLVLQPGAAPAVVVTRAELPHLAHIDNLTFHVRSEGNVWFAAGLQCPDHTVFFDTDRDGVIDRWDQMSEETYYRRYNRWNPGASPPYLRLLGEASTRR